MKLSLSQFFTMLEEIGNVMKLEYGTSEEPEERPLSGEPAFRLGQRIFRQGRRGT